MRILAFIVLMVMAFSSCTDCTDCNPLAEEPYLKIRFYNASDSSGQVVVMDSINHVWAGNYEYYQDTVNTYKLPLNMNEDISDFVLTFRDTTNYSSFIINNVSVTYNRSYIKSPDNTILVQCDIQNITSDFATSNLVCNDTLSCISNDAIFKIYR